MLRVEIAHKLFRFFEKKDIDYCVLGDSSHYASHIDSDVDIVISTKKLPYLSSVLSSFCKENNYRIIQLLQHEVTASYYVIADRSNNNGNIVFFHPDICSDYLINGSLYISANTLLSNRIRSKVSLDNKPGFYIPAPCHEFIYYLIKRINKGILAEDHLAHLRNQWSLDKQTASQLICEYWHDPKDSRLIDQCIQDNSLSALQNNIKILRKSLHHSRHRDYRLLWPELRRKLSRFINPTGLLIAFFGPDGSGKTSVINQVEKSVREAFRHSHQIHLRPRLGYKTNLGNAAVTDPHGKPARNSLLSLLKLGYLMLDYILGYIIVVRPKLVRSTLVIFDRYFHDILVDPVRYRHSAPEWVTRLFEKLIPRPEIIILLDARPEVLQSRKQEVTLDESVRQCKQYQTVLTQYPECAIIDANQPLEQVIADTNEVILSYLEHRFQHSLNH